MKHALAVFVAGVAAATSLPDAGIINHVYDLTPWSFATYALFVWYLFYVLTEIAMRRREAFGYALLWSFGYFLLGLNWVGNALLVGGNPYAWAYPLALIGLPLMLAPFLACAMILVQPYLRGAYGPLIFASAWALAEFLRGHLFTGFPWNLPSSIWSSTGNMMQGHALFGAYGMSFLAIFWAVSFAAMMIRPRKIKHVHLYAVVTFLAMMVYGEQRLDHYFTPTGTLQTVLVQANINQAERMDDGKLVEHFEQHLALSARPNNLTDQPTIIMWPETILLPSFISSSLVQQKIAALIATYPTGSVLMSGALRAERTNTDVKLFNSMVVMDVNGQVISHYDKHHLVPFGEYIPFQRSIPIESVAGFMGLQSGPGPVTLQLPNLPPVSPLICYEAIFPGAVTARDTLSPRAGWIASLTNDSWYGNSPGPRQHLAQARARAIEEGLPMLRVASTGISAAIDARGAVIGQINYGQNGVLVSTITLNNINTIYHIYGDVPVITLVGMVLLLTILGARRHKT